MNKILFICVLSLGIASLSAQQNASKPLQLNNAVDSASCAFGQLVGTNLKNQMPPDLNVELLMKAMQRALNGETATFDQQTATQVFTSFAEKANAAKSEKAKSGGKKFLEDNKKRAGVTVTASGLQYEVMKRGLGTESPKATDQVKVHYHGTNIDGSVFDSSVDRGEPITFGLNQVIPGWTEGVQLMHPGDKFKFVIPSELAYGESSPSPLIAAHATLIFEVELLEIVH